MGNTGGRNLGNAKPKLPVKPGSGQTSAELDKISKELHDTGLAAAKAQNKPKKPLPAEKTHWEKVRWHVALLIAFTVGLVVGLVVHWWGVGSGWSWAVGIFAGIVFFALSILNDI